MLVFNCTFAMLRPSPCNEGMIPFVKNKTN
jgi:hypothetical protein